MDELFLKRLQATLPPEAFEHFGRPLSSTHFRVNTLKLSVAQAQEQVKELGVDFTISSDFPLVLSVPAVQSRQLMSSSLVEQGLLYPQGLESMKAVMFLDPQPGETILDLCAAPGSKTSQIAALMNNEGVLMANEAVRGRFYRLKSVLEPTGAKATLSMVDGRRYRIKDRPFDRVLVDAPCSSEGRFKYDEPKSYAYWSPRKIKEMAHKQKGLMLNASRLVKPGGVLVYSTCTFAVEENEEVVEWLARKSEGLVLESKERIIPDGRMEGFFIAKWSKI